LGHRRNSPQKWEKPPLGGKIGANPKRDVRKTPANPPRVKEWKK